MKYFLEKYKDIYCDKEIVIFTCGPSLSDFNKEKMKQFCENKIVFTVKQSFHKYGDIANFHFFNDNNFLKYETSAIKIASSANLEWAKNNIWGDQKIDFFFQIINATGKIENSISYTQNFENMLLKSQEQRIWGPGIMYETVLPFAIHTGTKKIYVNGWDYTISSDGTLKHYYDESKAEKLLTNTGYKIGTMVKNEREIFLKSTENLYNFLKNIGIELELISSCSKLSNKFKRIEKI